MWSETEFWLIQLVVGIWWECGEFNIRLPDWNKFPPEVTMVAEVKDNYGFTQ